MLNESVNMKLTLNCNAVNVSDEVDNTYLTFDPKLSIYYILYIVCRSKQVIFNVVSCEVTFFSYHNQNYEELHF